LSTYDREKSRASGRLYDTLRNPMFEALIPFGLTERIVEQFTALRAGAEHDGVGNDGGGDSPLLGRVGRVDRGECDVFTDKGPIRAISDSQRSQNMLAPATGDWAMVVQDHDVGLVIDAILDRGSAMTRRDPSEQVVEQVLVANVDIVAVVHGLDREVNPAQLERFLVLAWDSGAQPVIVLSKADLAPDVDEAVQVASVASDVPVVVTSAVDGSGLDELRDHFSDGRSMVMIGPSGVGKSHLVNALVGEAVQAIGAVREGDSKGRHTTTTRDLLLVPGGGVLIDTPGIRAVGVWEADAALDRVFADVVEVAQSCRFRDCTHRSEPGCAVKAAVDAGELDSDRVDRYVRLWDEITLQTVEAQERARKQAQGRRRRRHRGRR